jgi:exopolysaccharide biosynthesis protein
LTELADWLIKQGAVTAFNLDGGGSSQLVVGDNLVNPYSGAPRKINNAILVMPVQ